FGVGPPPKLGAIRVERTLEVEPAVIQPVDAGARRAVAGPGDVPVVVAQAFDVVADPRTELARARPEHPPRPGGVGRVGRGVRLVRADRKLTGPFIGAAGASVCARLGP